MIKRLKKVAIITHMEVTITVKAQDKLLIKNISNMLLGLFHYYFKMSIVLATHG